MKRLVPMRIKQWLWRSKSKQTHARHLQKSTAYFDLGPKSEALARCFDALDSVPGWFNVDDFGHFSLVLRMQTLNGLQGDLLEIGSYHGRGCAVMAALLADGEKLFVCDAFDLIIDDSYKGDFEKPSPDGVLANIRRVRPDLDPERVVIHRCLSSDLGARLEREQQFRFVHIDGGHSADQTFVDLALAHSRLLPGGIVVMDDYHNREWPTVTEGADRYLETQTGLSVLADLNRHGAQGRKLYLMTKERVL